jgi:lactoylglutathione lyase
VNAEQGKVEHRGAEWRGPGYRYTTVQVFDCVAELEGILAPRRRQRAGDVRVLGETVR